MNRKKTYLWAMVPFLAIVVLFELIPVVIVLVRGFLPEGSFGFTLQHYQDIFTKKLYLQTIWNSVLISIVSSLVGIVVAFFGARAYHQSTGKIKDGFLNILHMTSNFSGVQLAFSYIILLGNVGVLVNFGKIFGISFLADFNIYSVTGLMLTYIYFQIPLATLFLIPAFDGLQKEWEGAVALLGGTKRDYWRKVGIPVLLPSILGTCSVLFANSISAYATAFALMQSNFSLLPIRLAGQFVGDVQQRPEFGSALASVLIVLMVLTIWLKDKFIAKNERGGGGK